MNRRQFVNQSARAALFTSLAPGSGMMGRSGHKTDNLPFICIFSKHLQWLGYREMAQLAGKIGFTGIDLTVRKGGHVEPENAVRSLPDAVLQIRDAGLEVPMITTGITDPDDPVTWRILETAGKLGIPVYRTGWYLYQEGIPVEDQLRMAASQLNKLQEVNRSANIAASYQNHSGSYIGSSGWDLLSILEGLDPRWTGVQFDIRHAMVEGPESWPYILELLAPYINSLDIKDYTWDGSAEEPLRNVPLGKGLVPFRKYMDKLGELGISADFSIHFEYPLGGAEHGAGVLGIPQKEFEKQTGEDLQYFKRLF
jgi:L-ribulose-5-phosphate 3-epimerase